MTAKQPTPIHVIYDRGEENRSERWTVVLHQRFNRDIGGKKVVSHLCLTVDDNHKQSHLPPGYRTGECVIGLWLGNAVEWQDLPGRIRKVIQEQI